MKQVMNGNYMNKFRMNFCIFIFCLVVLPKASLFSLEAAQNTGKPKKYNLSICAVFRNEKPYLKEWIQYHLDRGVDHIYLYNVGSTDRPIEILKHFIENKVVTLRQWPDLSGKPSENQDAFWALSTMASAYENAARFVALPETEWLLFLDIDEFLTPVNSTQVAETLKKYKNAPGIILGEDCFDASAMDDFPRKDLVIETVDMTANEKPLPRSVEKMIFKPEACKYFSWPPYRYTFQNERVAVKAGKNELRVNRYQHRHRGHYFFGKAKEKLKLDHRGLSDLDLHQLLQEYDIEDQERVIHQFIPELRKKIGLNPR
jgi:hypothetical protein